MGAEDKTAMVAESGVQMASVTLSSCFAKAKMQMLLARLFMNFCILCSLR